MKPDRIGRRNELFQRYRILLFEDRIEEVSLSLTGLEVKRFFFDEAAAATVRPLHRWPEALVAVVGAGLLFWAAVSMAAGPTDRVAAAVVGVIGLLALLVFAYVVVNPLQKVQLHGSEESLEFVLPRSRARGERALRRLVRAIEAYQSQRTPRASGPGVARGSYST
jgi:hypothetical protein